MERPSELTTQESLDRLRHEVEELRVSRERLARAAEADRRRLERELHDGVQQDLVALASSLQLARRSADDPSAPKVLLDELERDVRRALDAAAALGHRLWPPLLETNGLAPALRTAACLAGVSVRIDIDGPCPGSVAGAVYFSCVDVLESVGSQSTTTIAVRRTAEAVVFEVDAATVRSADVPATLAARLGDRVEALSGHLTIATDGDRVHVIGTLPLRK
jgi:signal transduction histidine kinase